MKAKLVFAVAVAICVTATDVKGELFQALHRGWYQPSGNEANDANNANNAYFASTFAFNEFRNYFVFDRTDAQFAGKHVVSGTFDIQTDSSGTPNPTLNLFDFTGDVADLTAVAPTSGAAHYTDLGTGTGYGSSVLPNNTLQSIVLNTAAINELRDNTIGGDFFVIGGAMAGAGQSKFFGTGGTFVTQLDLVLQTNLAPVSDPGGPYTIDPGFDLDLDGSASADPDVALGDSIVSWEWDVDGDGTYDVTGETTTVDWATLLGIGVLADNTYNLALRTTDELGAQHVQTTLFTVNPVPEPATCVIWALAGGSCGLAGWRRRRKAKAAA
ncbi:MAG: PEP-CTERM sorting domain-containing protein [Pirellulales bacterium]|nr:PEP-CTERM sorting domain-containing protein [Pirellulales bacterium]